ncbi:GntR family transcriptional regulator [Cupriavidus basilensis]|uniref:GntR family transcriptional regulator n=1 Tax=Cupriavidus basilensis TaxID=68895 RepID=UPI001ED95F4F|nr:GntR family transcriptional regulator [Cupriavidus basilensis]
MDRRSAGTSRARARTEEPSQNELAYAGLRERLTTLVYRPGEHLNISTLVDDLELGRTPINQALHRLANEGLVQILPRKGVVVSPLSIDDALHLIDVRLANERCAPGWLPSASPPPACNSWKACWARWRTPWHSATCPR